MRGAIKPFLLAGLVTALVGAGAAMAPYFSGAQWPSDVILTAVVCLSWIWAASRVVLRRA